MSNKLSIAGHSRNATLSQQAFKADSHDLRLMHAAAADGCISTEIGIFLFLHTAHFCRNGTHQTQLV